MSNTKHTLKTTIFICVLSFFLGFYFSKRYYISQGKIISTSQHSLPLVKKNNIYNNKTSYNGLVPVADYDSTISIDLRYAGYNNFTKKPVYPVEVCMLQKNTLEKLIAANNEFKTHGYRLKVWDAYRPADVQKYFWSLVGDRRFIADPYLHGSRHNRGAAVDVTLIDEKGNELEMPTDFDEFSEEAYRNNPNVSAEAKKNVDLLTSVMKKHGFNTIETEWWHFDDSNADDYPIINIPLNDIH